MLDLDYKEVAERYGGNKQKIAQAAALGALGPEGPLLAVTAGMYIDRMRAAQLQEQAPQQTVAQQVLAPQPQAQGGMPPQGLGAAAPQGAVPPQGGPGLPSMPPMGGAAPPPGPSAAPPVGMAEGGYLPPYASGGLTDLPIPDNMFDEPDNGGYASGGLVAFASGGGARVSDEEYLRYIWNRENSGRGDYDRNGRPLTSRAGAKYGMQVLPSTARNPGYGVAPAAADTPEEYNRVGRDLALAFRKRFGDAGGLAAYNMGPGAYQQVLAGNREMPAETRNYLSASNAPGAGAISGASAAPAKLALGATPPIPENPDLGALLGPKMVEGGDLFDRIMPKRSTEGQDMMKAEAKKDLDPAEQKKDKDYDMWSTLAEIGFNMASSNSPYFLQAVGAAAAAALPGARAAKKEREAKRREAIKTLADVENLEYDQAAKKVEFGYKYATDTLGFKDKQIARAADRYNTQLQSATSIANTNTSAEATRFAATESRRGYESGYDKQAAALEKQAQNNAFDAAVKSVQANPAFLTAMAAGDINKQWAILQPVYEKYLAVARSGGLEGSTAGTPSGMDYGPPPKGAVERVK